MFLFTCHSGNRKHQSLLAGIADKTETPVFANQSWCPGGGLFQNTPLVATNSEHKFKESKYKIAVEGFGKAAIAFPKSNDYSAIIALYDLKQIYSSTKNIFEIPALVIRHDGSVAWASKDQSKIFEEQREGAMKNPKSKIRDFNPLIRIKILDENDE